MTDALGGGFTYDIITRRKADGALIERLSGQKNRVPMEGLNDIATAYLKGGAGPANLYIGLWSSDSYTPDGSETAATLASLVTEWQGYAQTGRLPLVLGSVSGGAVSNAASLARFDMSAAATVNGAFLSTVQAKGAAAGKLLSVVRFANPRIVDASMYLEVLTGFQFVSL
jgi:hypothetical protein